MLVDDYHGFTLLDNTTLFKYPIEPDIIDQALERPDSFAYYGDEDLFETWAITFSTHRDDDTIGKSNWDVMLEELNEHFGPAGDKWQVMHASHWAVGWTDEIIMPIVEIVGMDDYGDAIYAVTEQFAWALSIRDALMDYPLLDETRYSEMEYDDAISVIDQHRPVNEFMHKGDWYEVKEDVPETINEGIFSWIFDTYSISSGEEIGDDEVEAAMIALGFADKMDDNEED